MKDDGDAKITSLTVTPSTVPYGNSFTKLIDIPVYIILHIPLCLPVSLQVVSLLLRCSSSL